MAPTNQQDPAPFLARLPQGPIRDSVSTIWQKLALLGSSFAGAFNKDTAPIALLTLSGAVSLANDTFTPVNWDTLQFANDPGKALWNSADPSFFTFPRDTPAGSVWLVDAHAQFEINGTGRRAVEIAYTDSTGTFTLAQTTALAGPDVSWRISTSALVVDPSPGAALSVIVDQTSGGVLNLENNVTYFTLTRLY